MNIKVDGFVGFFKKKIVKIVTILAVSRQSMHSLIKKIYGAFEELVLR